MADATIPEREQVAFMECDNGSCRGSGKWFNEDGNREWFVYEGDPLSAFDCPKCGARGRRYPY